MFMLGSRRAALRLLMGAVTVWAGFYEAGEIR